MKTYALNRTDLNDVHDVPLIVEKTMQDQQRRKKNIVRVVAGLPESQLTSDQDQFLALCIAPDHKAIGR